MSMIKSPGITNLTYDTTVFHMSTSLFILPHKTCCCMTQWEVLILPPWFHSFLIRVIGGDPSVTMHTGFLSGLSYCCSNLSFPQQMVSTVNSFMHRNSFQKFISYNKTWVTTKNKHHKVSSFLTRVFIHCFCRGSKNFTTSFFFHSLNHFLCHLNVQPLCFTEAYIFLIL